MSRAHRVGRLRTLAVTVAVAAAASAAVSGCGGGSSGQSRAAAPGGAAGASTGGRAAGTAGGGFEVLGPTGPGGAPVPGSAGPGGAGYGNGSSAAGSFTAAPGSPAVAGGDPTGGPAGATATGTGPGGGVDVVTPAANPVAGINQAYYVFMTSISGLDDDFNGGWVTELQKVAVPAMVDTAERAAGTLEAAKDHGVGTLRDDHRVLHIDPRAGKATLTDCLDEYNWYVVSDGSGQPDPGVARGYFQGTGVFVQSAGHWMVQSWRSEPTRCQF